MLEHQQHKKQSGYKCKYGTTKPYKNKSRTGRSNLRKVNYNQRSTSRIHSDPAPTLQTPSATWTEMDEAGFLETKREDGQEEVFEKIDGNTSLPLINSNGTGYFDWFGLLGVISAAFISQANAFLTNLNGTELGSGSSNISSSSQIDSIGELYNSS